MDRDIEDNFITSLPLGIFDALSNLIILYVTLGRCQS